MKRSSKLLREAIQELTFSHSMQYRVTLSQPQVLALLRELERLRKIEEKAKAKNA